MFVTRRGVLAATTGLSVACTRPLRAATAESAPTSVTVDASPGLMPLGPGGAPQPVLRYGDAAPLQIVRVKRGEPFDVSLHNGLGQATSLQWHGLRRWGSLLDPATRSFADVPAGATRTLRLTPSDSGTAWFHPRPSATNQTAQGLAGVLIVDETAPPPVDHDLTLLLSDWTPASETAKDSDPEGFITVNHESAPSILTYAPGARLRLRLISGSTRRVMVVACEGAKPMIIAVDGQPSDLFAPIRNAVPIGPGARFDWMLDLPREAGAVVRLSLRGTERVGGTIEADRPLVSITTAGVAVAARPAIAALPLNPALPAMIPLEAAKRADLMIDGSGADGWHVNGKSGGTLSSTPLLRVRRDDTMTLGLQNKSASLVPLRIHGHAVRLLHAKDDGWEPYWRDTLLLPPNSTNHVAFVADTPGQWLLESAFDAQAVGGLRSWFEVLG